jgi:hypothetical protein
VRDGRHRGGVLCGRKSVLIDEEGPAVGLDDYSSWTGGVVRDYYPVLEVDVEVLRSRGHSNWFYPGRVCGSNDKSLTGAVVGNDDVSAAGKCTTQVVALPAR